MGLYRYCILPRLCDLAMRNKRLRPFRERIIEAAQERVLEIGSGSGLNLELYKPGVREVLALEPDPQLRVMAQRHARQASCPVTFLSASADQIPLDDKSVDTVVTTWTLCTIPDAERALREMRRVLKPAGRLLFVEHGLAPDKNIEWWQNKLTPLWRHISGGCHLNRKTDDLICAAGFRIEKLHTGYMEGPKPMTFIYEGSAIPQSG